MSRRASDREAPPTRAVRWRVILASALLAGVVAGAVCVAVYAAVSGQRVRAFEDASVRDAKVNVTLVPPDLPAVRVPGLLARYDGPMPFDVVVLAGDAAFSSRSGLGSDDIPPGLRVVVDRGQLASAEAEVEQRPYLVVGAPLRDPPTPAFFFYSQQPLHDGLADLRASVLLGWLVVVATAVVAGALVARRRIAALTAAHERQRRFSSLVSHELRTPLGAMVTAASVLADQLEALPAESRLPAELLVSETRRLRRLVEELMELAHLDAGREQPVLEPLPLAGSVAATVRDRGWERDVELVFQGEVWVAGDRRRLDRITTNLVDNALRHGGGEAKVRVSRTDDVAVLEVADRGPGIMPEDLPRIFERFYRGAAVVATEGSGLGLAIAVEHARLLGGVITVDTAPGEGARFALRLPAVRPEPAPVVTEPPGERVP